MPFQFNRESKPVGRTVQVSTIPPEFAAALDSEWGHHKGEYLLSHDFGTAKDAAKHLAYAKAWGLSREEKVTVRKATAHKDDSEGLLRLTMEPFNPDAPKRGRKPSNNGNSAK